MILLFTATAFVAAALLFAVQPFAARQALPTFGGSPAVWNTAVMFFQITLLLGYVYAHLLTTRLRHMGQLVVHACVLVGALVVPIGAGVVGLSPSAGPPGVWQLVVLLATGVGLPFFAVSSAGPLVQRWFADTGHRTADDPYFLYAASNAGSFFGLLAYPFLIEPALTLPQQAWWWRLGFAVFAGMLLACGLSASRQRTVHAQTAPRSGPIPDEPAQEHTRPSRAVWRERGAWMFFAFVPSSLMIGVTQYLTTDIAAVPLLWVVPLGIYLATYVVAFGRAGARASGVAQRLWPFAAVTVVLAFLLDARQPLGVIVLLHLVLLAVAGCLCHGRLRESRPAVAKLTEFYLFLSIGGALSGVFHTFIAPLIFNDLHEYPLAIALACLAVPRGNADTSRAQRLWWMVPPALLVGALVVPRAAETAPDGARDPMLLLTAGVPALLLFLVAARPRIFFAATGALLLAVALRGDGSEVLLRERTFFGVHAVRTTEDGRYRVLGHGTTIHGMESTDPARRGEPLAYYHREGPVGDVFAKLGERFERVAFIGLGAGSMAAYGTAGQQYDFYEIDPTVARIAGGSEWFSYLQNSDAEIRIVLGDGRLSLASVPDESYDCIVLDAFSSDSIPVHLLTLEAVELYAAKLRPGGVLAFHLTNRHLDLGPFAAAAAERVGMSCVERQDERTTEQIAASGRQVSRWMVGSTDPRVAETLLGDVRWVDPIIAARPWTDARADIFAAMRTDPSEVYRRPSKPRK